MLCRILLCTHMVILVQVRLEIYILPFNFLNQELVIPRQHFNHLS